MPDGTRSRLKPPLSEEVRERGKHRQRSRVTGPPETLAGLNAKNLDIWCWCEDCQHNQVLPLSKVLASLAAETPVPDVAKHMKCSQCGSKWVTCRPDWSRRNDIAP